jgi:endonuclease V-like protein UPF0215 family
MSRSRRFSHVIGFDDEPFDRAHRGLVRVVGAVFAGAHLHGIISGRVRRDGAGAARVLAETIRSSRFAAHLQLIMLQGIAVAGFNVIDIADLHRRTGLPILIVARHQPDYDAIRNALLARIRGGARKWKLIEKAGPMERAAGVYVQRVGLTLVEAEEAIERFAVTGRIPEPLRVAHLVAGGMATGESRGRV